MGWINFGEPGDVELRHRGTPAGPGTGREVDVPFLSLTSRLYLSSERGHGCLHALRNAEKLGFRSLLYDEMRRPGMEYLLGADR